jgi:signal transduction histidine kinase
LSFTRILENLLSNAIKFSPKNTKVTVGIIVQEPDFFQFYVLDEGPGISVQDQAELFVAFQKGSSVATAGESSTGLGLSIVDKLTKLIQGTIQLESEPGKGAIFTVKLPIRLVNMESENDAEDLLLMN